MIKKAVASGVISLVLTGCGTVSTVLQDEADAAKGLRKQKTYCQSIPRVYSGLAYDFCVLNAPADHMGFLVPVALLDMTLSGILDTVVLPYTVYRQVADGDIIIYWRPAGG
ncbi:YceK/YidQ family lipoprotein [Pseudomonas sp. GM55]|uniref:YceK/YidQ family lipoprotein n=1 Tax=Pseudomonas sp. GM55 TaxID=1144333 RepID=UPI0002709737|nr:YceK/YidQ family lipoprotein [Pseudomonas sp. GM55]EJM76461.1 putative periplasmic lipoprotein [Pseudomonas sp. GM55]